MGKILEYNNFNAAPADDDLLFFSDANDTTSNPKTYRLKISDLNKKRNVDAATSAGLLLRDDSSTFGIKIHDGGNVGVGPGAATTPGALLSVRGAADSNLTLANFLNPSATTNGKYQQIIFGTDAANDKSVVFRYYYSTTDDASTLRIQSYEDAASDPQNEIGFHLKGDGNVGIGKINPAYPLDVKGTVVSHGAYPLFLDPSTGEIKSNSTTTLNFNKSANANVTFMYYDGDGSTVNPALSIKYSNKRIAIGNTAPDAKLHVLDTANGTDVLIQNSTNGAVLELRRDSGTTTSNSLYISNTTSGWGLGTAITAGATTVNISSTGQLALKNTTFSYDLTVASGSSDPISSQFKSDSTAGARILVECNGAQPATQDNLIGFPIKQSGGAREVGWMAGYFRRDSVNYFGIHYSSDNTPITSDFAFHGTLASNLFYLDTAGNQTIGKSINTHNITNTGHNTGRFVQVFAVGMRADNNGAVFPALNTALNLASDGSSIGTVGYVGTSSKTPDARYASRAPYAGKLLRIDVTTFFPNTQVDAATITPTFYFYSGSSLPSADGDSGMGGTNSANVSLGSLADDTSHKLGFNTFTDTANVLSFDAGDYLCISINTNTTSGYFFANLALTFEFDVT